MKILQFPLKLTTGLSIILSSIIIFIALVTWLAARETVATIAPIVVWIVTAVGLVIVVVFGLDKIQWFLLRRAEYRRDQSLAESAGRQAKLQADREQMNLIFEGRMMATAARQSEQGLLHASKVGSVGMTVFPRQVVNQIEAHAAPVAPPVLPGKVELSSLLPTGPSIKALALGIEATPTALQPLISPLASLVHVGVGGSSGWGKSVFLQCLAIQIALAPELAQLALIDIEGQTFSPFAALGRDRLRYPLADNEPDIIAILDDLKGEWKRRRQLFQRYPSAADLDSYNALVEDKLPPVVMMFDEINMVTDDKDIMGRLTRLGQGTRKYGVFCILGGQDWNAVSIPTKLRNNFSTRIQLKAMSKTQSRVMLEDSAAADIQDPGRAYVVLPGRGLAEIQTPYISKADIISTLSGRCGISPTMPVPISVIKSEPDQEESKVIAAYEKLRGGEVKSSWNAVVRAAYGDNKTGKFYHEKLKGTLDKFEIDY